MHHRILLGLVITLMTADTAYAQPPLPRIYDRFAEAQKATGKIYGFDLSGQKLQEIPAQLSQFPSISKRIQFKNLDKS